MIFCLLCQEELASSATELEETNHKLAALKAQRDNTQGTPILFPSLRNKNTSENKVRNKQRELRDLEATHKELTVNEHFSVREFKFTTCDVLMCIFSPDYSPGIDFEALDGN